MEEKDKTCHWAKMGFCFHNMLKLIEGNREKDAEARQETER